MPHTTRQPAASRTRYLPPGPHIAPYLTPDCEMVMVVIGRGRELVGEYPIPGAAVTEEGTQIEDAAPARLWQPGIHVAPWRAVTDCEVIRDGTVLLGIGGCRQLLCQMTVDHSRDVAAARAELRAQLEIIEESEDLGVPSDDEDQEDEEDE